MDQLNGPGAGRKGPVGDDCGKKLLLYSRPMSEARAGASLISSWDGENIQNLNTEKKGDAI